MIRTIGILQLMSASLYEDDAQLDSFTKTLVREHVESVGGTVVSEPRTAYSFGKLQHEGHDENDNVHGVECTDACAIVTCDESDATVVMMRVEVDVDE